MNIRPSVIPMRFLGSKLIATGTSQYTEDWTERFIIYVLGGTSRQTSPVIAEVSYPSNCVHSINVMQYSRTIMLVRFPNFSISRFKVRVVLLYISDFLQAVDSLQ